MHDYQRNNTSGLHSPRPVKKGAVWVLALCLLAGAVDVKAESEVYCAEYKAEPIAP